MRFLENETYRKDIVTALENSIGFETLRNKRVLILGATGLIGSFITDCLLYANYEGAMNIQISAVSRSRGHLEERFGEETKGFHFVEGSVVSLNPDAPALNADTVTFRPDGLALNADALTFHPDELAPNADALTFHPDELAPNADALTPKPEAAPFDPDTLLLKSDTSMPGSNVSTYNPDIPPDFIIHAASYAYPRAFREKPVETLRDNVLGTDNVLRMACRHPGCRVLYVSSGEVQEEVDHLSARACYPVGKKAGETLCMAYIQEYQVDAVIARPCHTFGANITGEDNRATAQFIANAANGQDIILNSPGVQERSLAYVADCVSALLTILACGKTGQVYGVATDEVWSIRQFAETCAETVQRRVVCREQGEMERAEASPIKKQIIDNTKLKSLGWKPAFTIAQGIEHSIDIGKWAEIDIRK